MTVLNFTTEKYKKSINNSKQKLSWVVGGLSHVLNLKSITYQKYEDYSVNHKLNHVYLLFDVMDLNAEKNKASWDIIRIIQRGYTIVSLGSRATVEQARKGESVLGPLYIDNQLYFTSPTDNQIFSHVKKFALNNIITQLEEEHAS